MIGVVLAVMLQSPSDIVVTGQRLEQAHRRCAARQCTPLEDARASIAHAEALFRKGQYQPAKRLLATATARNRDRAATAPRPVAALYEACATVSLHEGDLVRHRGAVADQVRTLRDHLPADDPSVMDGVLVLGDMWLKLGNAAQAERAYRGAPADARSSASGGPADRQATARGGAGGRSGGRCAGGPDRSAAVHRQHAGRTRHVQGGAVHVAPDLPAADRQLDCTPRRRSKSSI